MMDYCHQHRTFKKVRKVQSNRLNNKIFDPINENDKYANTEINYLAIYYHRVLHDYHNAEKYFLFAIEKGNIDAIKNIAIFYDNYSMYEKAEKYYHMSINNCANGNKDIAIYYAEQKNYKYAEIYYLIAIKKGEIFAILEFAFFYQNTMFTIFEC